MAEDEKYNKIKLGNNSEVKIKVDQHEFIVNKDKLIDHSSCFEAMFGGSGMVESRSQSAKLEGVHFEEFSRIVEFIQYGSVKLTDENIQDVYKAANMYLLDELSKLCLEKMLKEMTLQNCVDIYFLLTRYQPFFQNPWKPQAKMVVGVHFHDLVLRNDLLNRDFDLIQEFLSNEYIVVAEYRIFDLMKSWLDRQKQTKSSRYFREQFREQFQRLIVTSIDYLRLSVEELSLISEYINSNFVDFYAELKDLIKIRKNVCFSCFENFELKGKEWSCSRTFCNIRKSEHNFNIMRSVCSHFKKKFVRRKPVVPAFLTRYQVKRSDPPVFRILAYIDDKLQVISRLPENVVPDKYFRFEIFSFGYFLYYLGVSQHHHKPHMRTIKIWKLDIIANKWEFIDEASFLILRYSFIAVKNRIFMLVFTNTPYTPSHTCRMFYFDLIQCQWSRRQPRTDAKIAGCHNIFKVVVVENNIYLLETNCLRKSYRVYTFNVDRQRWNDSVFEIPHYTLQPYTYFNKIIFCDESLAILFDPVSKRASVLNGDNPGFKFRSVCANKICEYELNLNTNLRITDLTSGIVSDQMTAEGAVWRFFTIENYQ